MTHVPRSLGGRLLLGAGVFITVALVLASVFIGLILHRFVTDQVDQRLDMQIAAISSALSPDGSGGLKFITSPDYPPFDGADSGWYWQVTGDGVALRSQSLGSGSFRSNPKPLDWRQLFNIRPKGNEGFDTHGHPLHIRNLQTTVDGIVITIAVSSPRSAIAAPMRQALISLIGSLAVLGAGLILATFVQVRLGLRPLRRLHDSLMEIRAGSRQHVPLEQPTELLPLAAELNGLIDQNAKGLASARRHVSNLAHSLKTPLASLSIELHEAGRDPAGLMRALVDQIDLRIRHHLGRARAAATGATIRPRTPLMPHLADIAGAMARIHADRGLRFSSNVDETIAIACEAQDLDEMLGNLLDNAFKWAKSSVHVSVATAKGSAVIMVEDDGPGLPEALMPEALVPGRRLDETIPGHGFGLSITNELAELYGGGVKLALAPSHGLRANLTLPIAD